MWNITTSNLKDVVSAAGEKPNTDPNLSNK